jgi:hypothetical protein
VDEQSRIGLHMGAIISGAFHLTLRESCNKIIHAGRVVPEWASAQEQGVTFKYWDGTIKLSGEPQSAPWEVILEVADWARAMQRFLDEMERLDAFHYVGQDWYPKR